MEKKRILIVEDEGILALRIKSDLEEMGYAVVGTYASGKEALEGIKEAGPDLVLMDISLQGKMDGIETACRMNKDYGVPVIYLTAHSEENIIERAKITEPYGYILKPFTTKELRIVVEVALHKYKIDREKAQLTIELQKAHDELEERVWRRTNELSDANTALKVLLKQREEDKKELENRIISNVQKIILPCIEQLKKGEADQRYASYLNLLESSLLEIISPFSMRLSSQYQNLTQAEIGVINFIKEGKRSKEIAEILNISKAAVDFHRNNIRAKLGLNNTKTNLRTYLLSIK